MSFSNNWSVVKNYLKVSDKTSKSIEKDASDFLQDVSIKQIALDAIQGKVSEDSFKSLTAFSKAVACDGFNPQTIIIELATKASADKRSDDGEFKFSADGIEYSVLKKCDLARDVQMLATLFLVRGNNLFKILKTVSKSAKFAVSHKIAAYSIKSDDDADAAARKRKK